jgi:hypothetical protein
MSDSPTESSRHHAAPEEHPPDRRPRKPFARYVLLVFLVPLVLLAYVLIQKTTAPRADPDVAVGGRVHVIQLDVLNGSGQPRLAQRVTDYLRARGFDVVELGNYRTSDVEETMVLDRAGNLQAAQQVAAALGLPAERAVQRLDKTLYLDVTVIIGRDFQRLKPLQ